MDNPIDISKSYFMKKSNIKNRNKIRHRRIKELEQLKIFMTKETYHNKRLKEDRSKAIEFLNNEIKEIKNRINRDTLIYSY